ncbi:hypothetical protein PAAL109150_09375 [Paenibacillus alkaliterrae]
MDVREQIDAAGLYYPDNDYNFLLWTLLPKWVEEQAWRSQPFTYKFDKVAPARIDGGKYIAYAQLERSIPLELSFNPNHYSICGAMIRM